MIFTLRIKLRIQGKWKGVGLKICLKFYTQHQEEADKFRGTHKEKGSLDNLILRGRIEWERHKRKQLITYLAALNKKMTERGLEDIVEERNVLRLARDRGRRRILIAYVLKGQGTQKERFKYFVGTGSINIEGVPLIRNHYFHCFNEYVHSYISEKD